MSDRVTKHESDNWPKEVWDAVRAEANRLAGVIENEALKSMGYKIPELADQDDNVIELSVGLHFRVILNTPHGTVIIDVRKDDVNAFKMYGDRSKDVVLLP